MSEKYLWEKFLETGNISDYMQYKRYMKDEKNK